MSQPIALAGVVLDADLLEGADVPEGADELVARRGAADDGGRLSDGTGVACPSRDWRLKALDHTSGIEWEAPCSAINSLQILKVRIDTNKI